VPAKELEETRVSAPYATIVDRTELATALKKALS